MAEQLHGPAYSYVRQLVQACGAIRKLGCDELKFDKRNLPLPGGVVSFDQDKHPCRIEFQIQSEEQCFAVEFDWHWPSIPGVFARVEVEQFDSSGNCLGTGCQILGQVRNDNRVACLFRRSPDATEIKMRVQNAFHDSNASLRNLRLTTLSADAGATPVSTVGIVAADQQDLADCIDELVNHYEHYRASAEDFSRGWARQHQPRRTIAHLISTEQASLFAG